MQQDKLVIILADISGYTRFMLENRTSAIHGQICINSLIEKILDEVNIPLTLQEIEGDAVFLYVRHPGTDADWQKVLDEVGQKLARFIDVFVKRSGMTIEATPCGCAICRNSDQLGMKFIVHAGEAVFHELAGRPQVSGPDVILAHRLLKNSVPGNEYLLMTEPAFTLIGARLPGTFEARTEAYEGFENVAIRVRFLGEDLLAARDSLYTLSPSGLAQASTDYISWVDGHWLSAAWQQFRAPIRRFSLWDRMAMIWEAIIGRWSFRRYASVEVVSGLLKRGQRRTEWTGRPAPQAAAEAQASPGKPG